MKINREKVEQLVRTMKPLFTDSSRASQIKTKGACDYVTQVDIQVQKLIKEGLYQMYPQVQFMGEEQDNTAIDRKGDFWILDPVDGTTNLIHDFRHSTLSLAYAEEGTVELGIVYQPYTDEMFVAVKGKGAFLNGEPIHVSEAKTLSESLVTIGTSPYYHELADWNFAVFKKVFLLRQNSTKGVFYPVRISDVLDQLRWIWLIWPVEEWTHSLRRSCSHGILRRRNF